VKASKKRAKQTPVALIMSKEAFRFSELASHETGQKVAINRLWRPRATTFRAPRRAHPKADYLIACCWTSAPAPILRFVYLPEPMLETRTLGSIGRIGDLLAQLVLSVPQLFAMLYLPVVAGRRRLPVSGRRRRRLTDRDLANPGHRDLSLSMSGLEERAADQQGSGKCRIGNIHGDSFLLLHYGYQRLQSILCS
jgi:hypothetical protein